MKEICKVSWKLLREHQGWSGWGSRRKAGGLTLQLLTFSTDLVALDPVWWEITNLGPRDNAGSELTYCDLTGASVKSIQCQDEKWFTPSEFEIMGGRGPWKNWKLSLRCYNRPLKFLIQVFQRRGGRSVLLIVPITDQISIELWEALIPVRFSCHSGERLPLIHSLIEGTPFMVLISERRRTSKEGMAILNRGFCNFFSYSTSVYHF